MRTTAGPLVVVAVLVASVGLAGCSTPSAGESGTRGAITVGVQSGVSNKIVASLYGEALASAGYSISYNYGIGSRKAFLKDLSSGTIDVVPDYAGALLDAVDSSATAASTEDVMALLPTAVEPKGLGVGAASSAEVTRAYVTTKKFATEHALISIGDLAPIASAITIGSAQSVDIGSHSEEALAFSYGVEGSLFRQANDDAAVLDDLESNIIQVADLSTLSLDSLDNDLVVLSDPLHIVVAQNLVPVFNARAATPQLRETLDQVSAQLTSDDLADFATEKDELPTSVARQWLKREGIATS